MLLTLFLLAALPWTALASSPAAPGQGQAPAGGAASGHGAAPAATGAAPGHPGPAPLPAPLPADRAHASGELDCLGCHVGEHRGVVRMYVGSGGRGTPTIPSHMYQLRVECIACHVAPKEGSQAAALVGQTFRPNEKACVGCHTTKYRGMMDRWIETLVRMQAIVEPKLNAARDALTGPAAKAPGAARARTLSEDAAANLQFVKLGRGVHNVFYAADLLKVSNTWLDESLALLGAKAPKLDDQLVRGGYCAVLCHQQAGIKQREMVSLGTQRIPHVRHVSEFGATCTSCHSAETHKKVTATAATCAACHHSPQNDRCESCHRAQSAFFRGKTATTLVSVQPNLMAESVTCTGCHDPGKKPAPQAAAQKCLACHEPQYTSILSEWTGGFAADARKVAEGLSAVENAVARARRSGRSTAEADKLLRDARGALALVKAAGAVHNPLAADALLEAARQKGREAEAKVNGR